MSRAGSPAGVDGGLFVVPTAGARGGARAGASRRAAGATGVAPRLRAPSPLAAAPPRAAAARGALWAILAAALLAPARATDTAVALSYVSGKTSSGSSVTADDAVSGAHDLTTTALVLKVTVTAGDGVTFGSSGSGAGAWPSASAFLSVSGPGATGVSGASFSSAVTFARVDASSSSLTIVYTATFAAATTATGTATIAWHCTQLSDVTSGALSACSPATGAVSIATEPTVALQYASTNTAFKRDGVTSPTSGSVDEASWHDVGLNDLVLTLKLTAPTGQQLQAVPSTASSVVSLAFGSGSALATDGSAGISLAMTAETGAHSPGNSWGVTVTFYNHRKSGGSTSVPAAPGTYTLTIACASLTDSASVALGTTNCGTHSVLLGVKPQVSYAYAAGSLVASSNGYDASTLTSLTSSTAFANTNVHDASVTALAIDVSFTFPSALSSKYTSIAFDSTAPTAGSASVLAVSPSTGVSVGAGSGGGSATLTYRVTVGSTATTGDHAVSFFCGVFAYTSSGDSSLSWQSVTTCYVDGATGTSSLTPIKVAVVPTLAFAYVSGYVSAASGPTAVTAGSVSSAALAAAVHDTSSSALVVNFVFTATGTTLTSSSTTSVLQVKDSSGASLSTGVSVSYSPSGATTTFAVTFSTSTVPDAIVVKYQCNLLTSSGGTVSPVNCPAAGQTVTIGFKAGATLTYANSLGKYSPSVTTPVADSALSTLVASGDAVVSSRKHDTTAEDLVLTLTVTVATYSPVAKLSSTAPAAADLLAVKLNGAVASTGVTVSTGTVDSSASQAYVTFTVTLGATAAAGTYSLVLDCSKLTGATRTTQLTGVNAGTTCGTAASGLLTVNVATVPTKAVYYFTNADYKSDAAAATGRTAYSGANTGGVGGADLSSAALFLESKIVGSSSTNYFSSSPSFHQALVSSDLVDATTDFFLAVVFRASATQQLKYYSGVGGEVLASSNLLYFYTRASGGGDTLTTTAVTVVSKAYAVGAGGSSATVANNAYAYILKLPASSLPGTYVIKYGCGSILDASDVAVGSTYCTENTFKVGFAVTRAVTYTAATVNVNGVAISSGDTFSTATVHTSAGFSLTVTFAAPSGVTFASSGQPAAASAIAVTYGGASATGVTQGAATVTTVSGISHLAYTVVFSSTSPPGPYKLAYLCTSMLDTAGNYALAKGCNGVDDYDTATIGTVPTVSFKYGTSGRDDSGLAVTAAAAVSTSIWHDVDTADLEVIMTITAPSAGQIAAYPGTRASILKVAAASDSGATFAAVTDVTTGVTIDGTTALASSAANALVYKITFGAAALRQSYKVWLDCSAAADTSSNALGNSIATGGCQATGTLSSLVVKLGFQVTPTIVYTSGDGTASAAVDATKWHNAQAASLVLAVKLTATTDGSVALATSGGRLATAAGTLAVSFTSGGSLTGVTLGTAASTTAVWTAPLTFASTATADTYTLAYTCQSVTNSLGASAVKTKCLAAASPPVTVKVGFLPTAAFVILDASADFLAADRTDAWFSNARTDLTLVVTVGGGATAFSYSATADVPDFATAVTGVADSTAASATQPTASKARTSSTVVTYSIASISGLTPETYTFTFLSTGAFTAANGAKSVAFSKDLLVGYDVALTLFRGTDAASNVLLSWQDPCVSSSECASESLGALRLRLASTAAVAFTSAAESALPGAVFYSAKTGKGTGTQGTGAADFAIGGSSSPYVPTASISDSSSHAYLEWSLVTARSTTRPDAYSFQVKPGGLPATLSSGTKSASNAGSPTVKVLIGFRPGQAVYEGSGTTDMSSRWVNPASAPTFVLLPPSSRSLTTAAPSDLTLYGTAAGTFASATAASGVTPVGVVAGDTAQTLSLTDAGTIAAAGLTFAVVSTSDTIAGVYSLSVAQGRLQLADNSARNYAMVGTLNVGFGLEVHFSAPSTEGFVLAGTAAVFTDIFFNAANTVSLEVWLEQAHGVTQVGGAAAASTAGLSATAPSAASVATLLVSGAYSATAFSIAAGARSSATSTGAYVFAVTTASLGAGQYALDIADGVVSNLPAAGATGAAKNFAFAGGRLKIGFTPALALLDENGADISAHWVDQARSNMALRLLLTPPAASSAGALKTTTANAEVLLLTAAYAVPGAVTLPLTTDSHLADRTTTNAGDAVATAVAAVGFLGTYSAVALTWPLDLTGTTAPSSTPVRLLPGKYCNTGTAAATDVTICNAPTVAASHYALQIGFVPVPRLVTADLVNNYRGLWNPDWTNYVVSSGATLKPIVSYGTHLKLRVESATALDAAVASAAFTDAFALPAAATADVFRRPAAGALTDAGTVLTYDLPADAAGQQLDGIVADSYDVALTQGTMRAAAGAFYNARAKITLRLGPQVVFYGPTGTASELLPTRARAGGGTTAFTGLSAVRLRVDGTSAGPAFSALFPLVNATGGASARDLMTGLTASPVQASLPTEAFYLFADYLVGIDNLPDGEFLFRMVRQVGAAADGSQDTPKDAFGSRVWATRDAYVRVDRTPPSGSTATWAGATVYAGAFVVAGALPLPATLFADAVSDAAHIVVTSVVAADDHGLSLGPAAGATLATAYLYTAGGTTTVREPAGVARFVVTARDEAGNSNSSVFLVPILDRAAATLVAVDARARSSAASATSTLRVGGPPTRAGNTTGGAINVTLTATYGEAVAGVTGALLACSYSERATPGTLVDCGLGGAGGGATFFAARAGGTVYTWTLLLSPTLVGGDAGVTRTAAHGRLLTLSVGATGVTTLARGTAAVPSNAVLIAVDNVAPVAGALATAASLATVGGPFFEVVSGLFADTDASGPCYAAGSPPTAIALTMAFPPGAAVAGTRTVSSGLTVFGLTFSPGLQGAATTTVSGKASLLPAATDGNAFHFTITGEDEAGNVVQPVVNASAPLASRYGVGVYSVRAVAAPPGALLVVEEAPLVFKDVPGGGTPPAPVAPLAEWSYADAGTGQDVPVTSLRAVLIGADADATVNGVLQKEALTQALPIGAAGATVVAFSRDATTGVGTLGLDGSFSPAIVQAWLRTVDYTNSHTAPSTGGRVVRFDIAKSISFTVAGGGSSSGSAQVATRFRAVTIDHTNNPPVLVIAPVGGPRANTVGWDEAANGRVGTGGVALFPGGAGSLGVTLSDADDYNARAATVSISSYAGAPALYGPCDPARDRLRLPSGYATVPTVLGTYDAVNCILHLTPRAPPAASPSTVPFAQLAAALAAVEYYSADVVNPTNWRAWGGDPANRRLLSVAFTDDAAAGADTGQPLTSAPGTAVLTVTPADDAPTMNRTAVFGPGGLFTGTAPYANLHTITNAGLPYEQRALTIVLPQAPDASLVTGTWAFDLTQDVDAAGAPLRGSFGRGAIRDPDTASPISLADGAPGGLSEVAVEFWDGVSLDAVSGLPAWGALASMVTGSVTAASFLYSPTVPSTLSVTVSNAAGEAGSSTTGHLAYGGAGSGLGTYALRLVYGAAARAAASVDRAVEAFFLDVRRSECLVSNAPNFLRGPAFDIAAGACAGASTAACNAELPVAVCRRVALDVCDAPSLSYYPAPQLCTFEPTSLSTAGGAADGSAVVSIAGGDVAGARATIAAKLARLTVGGGLTAAAAYAALAEERAAARGSFNLDVVPASLPAPSLDLHAGPPAPATLALFAGATVAVGGAGGGAPAAIDTSVMVEVKLTPVGSSLAFPGQSSLTFSPPVRVCLFAGDTPDGHYQTVAIASWVDAQNHAAGVTPWSVLSNASFDKASGQVCADADHFSFLAPAPVPLPPAPTVPKMHLMGGSCPLHCSDRGFCRTTGECVCFAGYEGRGCEARACPAGVSWGADSVVAQHGMTECSSGGRCNHETGECECFPGYEGAACQRLACPGGPSCSGHGRCRLMAELPGVAGTPAAAEWAASGLQRCVCDAGYAGGDCSLRSCPRGDDIKTLSPASNDTVVTVTLSFAPGGVLRLDPADVAGDGRVPVRAQDDALALDVPLRDGRVLRTPPVWRAFDGAGDDEADALVDALRSLPGYAVRAALPDTPARAPYEVAYRVTFPWGASEVDRFRPAACAAGCPARGCRPKLGQLRSLVMTPAAFPGVLAFYDGMVLAQPPPVSAGDEAVSGVWGVASTLVIAAYARVPADADPAPLVTYRWANTRVYGQPAVPADVAAFARETPIPPSESRAAGSPLAGPYGLAVVLDADDAAVAAAFTAGAGPWTYAVRFSLPACTVATTVAPSDAPHTYECGNRGLCNTASGVCDCFEGFGGVACDFEEAEDDDEPGALAPVVVFRDKYKLWAASLVARGKAVRAARIKAGLKPGGPINLG